MENAAVEGDSVESVIMNPCALMACDDHTMRNSPGLLMTCPSGAVHLQEEMV